jgi:hypothetical protein
MTAYDDAITALGADIVRYWPLDDTSGSVADDRTNNADGAYVGSSVTFGAAGVLREQDGVATSGTGEITLPVSGLTGAGTIFGWYHVEAGSTGYFFRDSSTGIWYNPNSPEIRLGGASAVTITGASRERLGSGRKFVAFVMTGSQVDLYIDGDFVQTFTSTADLSSLTSPLHVGRNGTVAQYVPGRYAGWGVASRALTATEIEDLYEAGRQQQVSLRSVGAAGTVTGSSVTPTAQMPATYVAGDRLLIVAVGKPDTASPTPSINQGWTVVGRFTGGTGTQAADTGALAGWVFAKDATSSSETTPTITWGDTASVRLFQIFAYMLDDGDTWADAIATSAAWVQSASDTNTASPLTGTAGTFTDAPTVGDAILILGGIPTDSGTSVSSGSASIAGASTFSESRFGYNESATGNDIGQVWQHLYVHDGTASAGAAASFTVTSATDHSGLLLAIALRRSSGGTTVNGGLATETDTAFAGTVIGPVTVTGGLASEADTGFAATVAVGALVQGGLATETDAAPAGTVVEGVVINGGLATETDTTFAGSVIAPITVTGGIASEADTALAATVTNDSAFTRFYLPAAGVAPAEPAFGGMWEVTSNAYRFPLVTALTGTSGLVPVYKTGSGVADALSAQYVSGRHLTPGLISGTFDMVVCVTAASTAAEAFLQVRVAVVSEDGTVERGELYSGQTALTDSPITGLPNTDPNYEIYTSSFSRYLAGITMTPVTSQAGDRLVVELGARFTGNTSSVLFNLGDPFSPNSQGYTVTDMPLNATSQPQQLRPWIEFDTDLFAGSATINGGLPSETETTLAGTVTTNVNYYGGVATEYDQAIGANTLFVDGGVATESDDILPGATTVLPEIEVDVPVHVDTDLVGTDPVDPETWDEEWHTYPAAGAAPAWAADDVAFVLDTDGTKIEKRRTRLRDRVVIGGVDVTLVNGKHTKVPDFQRMKPFSFGPGSMTITGINPLLDDLSSYAWLTPWAKILVQRLDDEDNVVATDYRGRVVSLDVSGAELTVDLGGMFSGPASVHWRPKAPIRRRADVTYWLHAMFRKNQQPDDYDDEDEFGVTLTTPPQGYYLSCALDTVASAVKRDGTALTYWYDEDAHQWAHGPVDRDTIHATVYADHGHTRLEVTQDHSADKNQVFASGYDENGGKIAFYVAPGMQEVPAEERPYPLESGDPFGFGTLDEDTTDGAGISRLIYRLMVFKFLQRDDKGGGYDADVEDAVADARIKAKMDDYGIGDPMLTMVDPDLWNWLWDADGAGYTMKEARQEPAYEVPELSKDLYGATGQYIGPNPDYVPSTIPVSEVVDFTTQMRKGQMVRRSKRMVETGPNWSGTLTMQHGLIAGEHNPGDPFDVADIVSNRDVREGWNLWVPNFDGGTLFHVSGIDVSDDGFVTRFMIDTRARDTLTINAILDRQAENRLSPSKAFWRQQSGHSTKNAMTGFLGDDIGGRLGHDVLLTGGSWTVFDVPVGDYGLVQRFRTRVREYVSDIENGLGQGSTNHDGETGLEHQVRVFGEKVTAGWLNNREANPQAEDAEADYKAALSDYKGRGLLAAYGVDPEDPCGYGDGHKGDGDDLTGNFFDDSGFPFRSDDCKAYVGIWVPVDALQLAGWVFRWQLDEGT